MCGDYSSHVQTKEKDGEGEKSKLGGSEMERREDRDRAIDRNKGGGAGAEGTLEMTACKYANGSLLKWR